MSVRDRWRSVSENLELDHDIAAYRLHALVFLAIALLGVVINLNGAQWFGFGIAVLGWVGAVVSYIASKLVQRTEGGT